MRRLQGLLFGVLASLPSLASACATCGQAYSFTPKLLVISTAFFLLPIAIVAIIAWKLWKGEENSSKD
ncbi:MAG: hypothetical protein ABIR96_04495 [Bdellovibrionota bacterium]